MLARQEFWDQARSWRGLAVLPRVVLAEAGLLFALLSLLAAPMLATGAAGYRRWAIGIALGAQILVLWVFLFFSVASYSNYLHTMSFLMAGDLALVVGDHAQVAKELYASLGEILEVGAATLAASLLAAWPLLRFARAAVALRTIPMGRRAMGAVAAGLLLMGATAAELAGARSGLASRVFRVSTPELALLHERFLNRFAEHAIPLVMPEDLSLLPVEPMAKYVRRAGPPPDSQRWNLIVLMLESVPARRVGLYGYRRPTTPALDRIGRESLVFDDALAVASSSGYAQLAALSSLYPLKYTVRDQYTRLDYPRTLLWDVLRPLGWTTAIFSSQDERWNNMDRFLRTPNLDLFFHSPSVKGEKVSHRDRVLKLPDRVTMDRVIKAMDVGLREPFAWYVNLQGTHHPYLPVAGCRARFEPATIHFRLPYGRWPKDKAAIVGNAFDSALACVDAQIGRLDAALRERGLGDRTILVITADHGEGFYEHATPNHGLDLYRELLHVPWLLRAPELVPPGRFRPTVSQLDILPTVLGRMGFSEPHPNFQGVDVLAPGYTDHGRDFCASVQYGRNLTAIQRDGGKLVRNIATGSEEFFDVRADPHELRPLRDDPRVPEYRRRLQAVVQRQLVYYADDALVSRYYPPPIRSDVPLRRWRAVGISLDFESGRYEPSWEALGTAFGREPASVSMRGRIRRQSGFRGRHFANSLLDGGDDAKGELLSLSFPIVGERMQVLVGGGADPQAVGVELLIDGAVAYRASGQGADGFNPVWWDVARYRGRTARVRIYDRAAGPMAHILIDDIRQFVLDTSEDHAE